MATSDLVYRMSPDWRIMLETEGQNFVAQNTALSTGWFKENVHTSDQERVWAAIQQAIRDKKIFEMEHRVFRSDGAEGWAFSRAIPILTETGEIKEWFGVARDITELVKARRTIEQGRKELERLVEERTAALQKAVEEMEEFSYSVSHDLRAPLRSMLGFAELLRADAADRLNDSEKGYLSRILSGVSRMERLTQDVLRYSKVGQAAIELTPISLEALVNDCLEQYMNFSSGEAELVVKKPLHEVLAHEPLLMQTLSNLIGNALKFVAEGKMPRIHIYTEPKDNWIRLYIEDNGIGISSAHQNRIWGMFERLHPNDQYEGTGIGLSIVKKAVKRMGGSVGVESDGRSGSKFWVDLPSAAAKT